MRIVLLGMLFLLMVGVQAVHTGIAQSVESRAALVFGFLLLFGFILGEIFARWSVPRITSYLIAGMACGPSLLGLIDREVIEHLRLVDDLALALIAFTAGAELKTERLRSRLRSILSVTFVQTATVFLITSVSLWALRPLLGFSADLSQPQFFAVVGILGIIATATSPSTAVAVIVEARSRGDITDTVLGCTVLKDIVVLIGFSILLTLGVPYFATGSEQGVPTVGGALIEVLFSLGTGVLFGVLMILYLRFVRKQLMLFVLASAFLTISLAEAFHLDHLLLAVMAGFAVSNFSRQGKRFLDGLEQASAPVFLIFFCMAGAGLNLLVLMSLWSVALVYVLLRGGSTVLGTALGAKLARDSGKVSKLAWTGFIGQAGVSLGLAALVRKAFPGVGATMSDLIVGGIVINQLVGPIAFRWALLRAGEACRN